MDHRLSETLHDLVQTGRRDRLAQALEEAHAADIAAAMRELSIDDQVTVFRLLGREQAGAVLAELDDQTLLELVRARWTRRRSPPCWTGCSAYLWKGQLLLAVIIGVAMVINMLVAAIVGVVIPLLPSRASGSTRP